MDTEKLKLANWLVPFEGFNYSGAYNLNFLYQEENVYIMDNHRAALWCWYQHINIKNTYSIFHIDRHTDALKSQMSRWISALPKDIHRKKLNEYLSYEIDSIGDSVPIIRWDNYLSIFLALHPSLVNHLMMATHNEGDKPNRRHNTSFKDYWDIPDNFNYWTKEGDWIVNIDLDYFFCDLDDGQIKIACDDYIFKLFDKVIKKLQNKTIKVLTIALSPEYSGGWKNSVDLCNKISKHMGLSFNLDYVSDDEYLRSIDGMAQSIQDARREPDCNGVTLDKLEW